MSIKRLEVEKFKELLLQERARLSAESKRIQRRESAEDQSDETSELSDYDNHPADAASETFEREKDMALDRNVEHLVDAIDRALGKIDSGTYGVCDRCALEISKERLKALPYATFCIDCQDIVEGR